MEQLNVGELIEFAAGKRVRKKLLGSRRIVGELLCYEPGQSTPLHQHPAQDECFFVLEGAGTLLAGAGGEQKRAIRAHDLILMPAATPHALTADAGSRLVLIFFKAPATASVASSPAISDTAADAGS